MNENSTISNAYDGKHDEYGHDLPRWMNFEHVIDIGEADPTQTATDYYGSGRLPLHAGFCRKRHLRPYDRVPHREAVFQGC